MNEITHRKNTVVFVDYTTIYDSLRRFGLNPMDINFFPTILDRLNTIHELNVIECFVYANFDSFPARHQTLLRQMGLTTRHLGRSERGYGNLLLSIEALTTLYENPTIDVFVIVSGDNDLIPLFSAARYKNKFTFLLALKFALDPDVLNAADGHEYLDDIFGLETPTLWEASFDRRELTFEDVRCAQTIAKLFYNSNIWRRYQETGEPVTFKGYLKVVNRVIEKDAALLRRDFELAHYLRYITIYQENQVLYLKNGSRCSKVIGYN